MPSRLSEYDGLILAGICALLFLPGLGSRDFWAPGEPIYAETLRVMFDKGEWVVPTLNGHLFPDKPVLYYWLALIVSKLAGGVSEWTLRLPTALGATGMVLVTFLIGKTFFDRRSGFLAGVILATSYRIFWEARFLRLDTVLSFFLLLGFYFFLAAFADKKPKGNYLLAYACFALATLTKGPLGLVLPGLTALCLLAFTGRWDELRKMRLISGIILVTGIVSPWLILLHLRGEDQWVRDFLLIHNIQNYALEPIGHVRPFYYYLTSLPLDFLPWTLLIPGALIFYYPWRRRLCDPATLGLSCWFAVTFLFFTISKSKIAYYLLPLLPSLALLLGCYLSDWFGQNQQGVGAWHSRCSLAALWLLAVILLAGAIASPVISKRLDPGIFPWALGLGLVLLGGVSLAMAALWRRQIMKAFWFLTGSVGVAFMISGVGILPYFDKYKSPRLLAELVKSEIPKAAQLFIFRSTMTDFNYYAQRETIPVLETQADLDKAAAQYQPAYLLINEKDLKYLNAARSLPRVTEKQVGDRTWYLLNLAASR